MEKTTGNKFRFYEIIDRIVEFNKLSHAYLIEIDDYNQDFECILDFVKLILCQRSEKKNSYLNCSSCNICKLIDDGNYVDLKIIEPEGMFFKKKQLIELQEEYNNKSLLDNKRIYIIKEADKFNDASANTILKFLEEPEDDIIAILVTTNRYKVIETILSRCQILSLQGDFYKNNFSEDVLDLLNFIVKREELFINYKKIHNDIIPDKQSAKNVLFKIEEAIICYLNFISNDKFECDSFIVNILKGKKIDDLTNYISIIEDEIKNLEYNVNYKLWLDNLFAKLIGG